MKTAIAEAKTSVIEWMMFSAVQVREGRCLERSDADLEHNPSTCRDEVLKEAVAEQLPQLRN
jgi:hypothetical protein